jgi:hypothetical protein
LAHESFAIIASHNETLYSSTSLAFTHYLRVTRDRDGIDYYCSDADSAVAGLAGPMAGSQSRVYILHEHDWERAVELLRGILSPDQPSAIRPSTATRRIPGWLVPFIVILIVLLVGAAITK